MAGSRGLIRRAGGSGRWFPGDERTLRRMVGHFIDSAEVPVMTGAIVAVMSPHAGYTYSGPVAGYSFRALRDQAVVLGAPETVVVLGFGHRAGFPGVAFMDGEGLETPLGIAPLDTEAAEALCAGRPRLSIDYTPHPGEHSAENQVPFVQMAVPSARLVVGLIGDHSVETRRSLAESLVEYSRGRRIVVVASSDMLHDPDYERVTQTDRETLAGLVALDETSVVRRWSLQHQVLCGIMPVLTVLQFAGQLGCRRGVMLHYRNSGDDFPESRGEWVVGYGAVAFPGEGRKPA